MRSTGVHHVDLVVSSLDRSLTFYRDLLAPLGWRDVTEVEGERGETIHYITGRGTSIGLREAQSPSAERYDRYAVGLHHLAIEVDSRVAVYDRYEWVRGQDVEIENPPKEYGYMPGYYAFFFYDPDGIKLEILYVPPQAA